SAHLDARTRFPRRHPLLPPEVSIEIRNVLKSALKADIRYAEGVALEQRARPRDPNLANAVDKIVAGHSPEVPREGRLVHSDDRGRGRHSDVVNVPEDVFDDRADFRASSDRRFRLIGFARQKTLLRRRDHALNEADEQGDPRQTVRCANLQQELSARVSVMSVKLDPAAGLRQERGHFPEFGKDGLGFLDEFSSELEDHVSALDQLSRADVAHPVVRKVGADQQDVAGSEWPDMVADEHLAGALGNHVDFVFRMIVPARERTGVVVPMPAEGCQGIADDQLEVRIGEHVLYAFGASSDTFGAALPAARAAVSLSDM